MPWRHSLRGKGAMPPRLQLLLPPALAATHRATLAGYFLRRGVALPTWASILASHSTGYHALQGRGQEGVAPGLTYRERGGPRPRPAWEIGTRFVQRPGGRLRASML